MKKNIGGIDRVELLIVAFFSGALWVWIGIVSLLTGLLGRCVRMFKLQGKIMNRLILILFCLLSLEAWADFKTLSTSEVQEKIKQGVAIIDIRRQDEYDKYGVIPNAHKLTFFDNKGNYNAQKWLKDLSNIIKSKDTPFILVCAHANRSKTVGKFLNAKTGYKNIFELAGGINYGWIDKGLSTTKTPASDTKPWYKIW
ncbi:hypothetical protein [uncultured Gammaproteobacteria bacterium]|nr:hypothetical protein [uncultured Gammaproteobacteria bacterium]